MVTLIVNRLLNERNFSMVSSTQQEDRFSAPLSQDFSLVASCTNLTTIVFQDLEILRYSNIQIALAQGGQHHVFYSMQDLETEMDSVLTELKAIAADPAIITCPICDTHYVGLQLRRSDASPYLGCNAWIEEKDKAGYWCKGERPGLGLVRHC